MAKPVILYLPLDKLRFFVCFFFYYYLFRVMRNSFREGRDSTIFLLRFNGEKGIFKRDVKYAFAGKSRKIIEMS